MAFRHVRSTAAGVIAIEPRSIPFVICNPDRSPSRVPRGLRSGGVRSRQPLDATRDLLRPRNPHVHLNATLWHVRDRWRIRESARQLHDAPSAQPPRVYIHTHRDAIISRCAWYGIKSGWRNEMKRNNKSVKLLYCYLTFAVFHTKYNAR